MTAAPQAVDLLLKARWIVPVVPRNQVLSDHALAIADGRIASLMPAAEADDHFAPRETLDLGETVLFPGLINSHGHAAMSLLRGYADDLPLMTWLQEHIWPAESRWIAADFVRDGAELAVAEMLRGGVTTFSDMYFFPDQTAAVAARSGIRAQVCFPIIDFPTNWAQNPDEYLSKGLAVRDEFKHHALVSIGFGPHAPYTVSDGPMRKLITLADELDAPIQIHLHETAFEVDEAVKQTGQRPSQRLHDLGLLGPRTQCVHMTQVDDSDLELLATTGASVIHCPESNLKLASGYCPVQRLLSAGVNVALGTDGAASNNDLDLLGEARTAALLAKAVAGDAGAVDAHAALRMATLNGAKALGLDDVTGSLEPGKSADIAAIHLDDLAAVPLYNPVSHLIYNQCSHRVSHVWVAGKALLADGELQTLNQAEIAAKARRWAERVAAGRLA